jgi:hypothetical protein
MAYDQAQLLLAVQSLRPGLENGIDFELACIAGMNQISVWNRTDVTAPTAAEIEAVDTDALLAARQQVLPQDLMAQFSADDAAKIQAAIAGSIPLWLLWSAMIAQRDPMLTGNTRFKAGWSALVTVLGQDRMNAIAASLGVTV